MSSLTWKRQPELFKFDLRRHRCKANWNRLLMVAKEKRWFRGRKVARKPGMLPQTNLLKCMRSSWQIPFETINVNENSKGKLKIIWRHWVKITYSVLIKPGFHMLHFIADHRRCSFPMNCDELGLWKAAIGDDPRSSQEPKKCVSPDDRRLSPMN